jgi:alanine racemase
LTNKNELTNWLEIDLKIIQSNLRHLQKISNKPVMAVLKANAYGHGLVEVGRAAEKHGIKWLGVARLEEALALRKSGNNCRIFVLGYVQPAAILSAARENIAVAIYDQGTALAYSSQMKISDLKLLVHAKFDTGMGRLGVFPEMGVEFVRYLHSLEGLEVEGAFTHFAKADDPLQPTTDSQMQRFNVLIDSLQALGLRPLVVHASNSAGTIYFPHAKFDLVRPGIAMYGFSPSKQAPVPPDLQTALTWKSRLISVKTLPPGSGIGYSHRYVTQKDERIGVIAVGYADGFRRTQGNSVLIRGKKVQVVGNVCMDQTMVQLDAIPEACIGDEVVLIGTQNEMQITADDLANCWGTINYEVVTSLANRITRIYSE